MTTETEHDGCDHDFNKHVVLASKDPMEGGIIRCPQKDCPCEATWHTKCGERPDPELVAYLRESFEAGWWDDPCE